MQESRLIGRYSQGHAGPMLVLLGAMHGNEPAGIYAIRRVLRLLEEEKAKNSAFEFKGSVIGLIANLEAYKQGVRFINKDLNRSWHYEDYRHFINVSQEERSIEQNQIVDIIEEIRKEIHITSPESIVVLDIHTTSAYGGIFSIITDDPLSEKIAVELHAPVIKGMLDGITGSSIHFFHGNNMGIPTTAIGFEAGQHYDPSSIDVATSAIVNCMRTIGCVQPNDVENKHDDILLSWSQFLPKIAHYHSRYAVKDSTIFKMLPGYKSFDKIVKDQHLADDIDGPVFAEVDAYLLLPLYQMQGEDGFFLIVEDV
jgi:succinylglutamate desuccinylase